VISEKLKPLMANNSVIRAMFEEGAKMREKYGSDNVYDFSLGNPNVPVPPQVNESMIRLLKESEPDLHAYMNNAGFPEVREIVAKSINKDHGTNFSKGNIIMTCGAAGGINVALNVIMNPGDEVLIFVPFFLEYIWHVNNVDGKIVRVKTDENFMPDLADFESKITDKTRVLLLNSPNNPTGVVYPAEVIAAISEIMTRKQKEFNRTMFILSDEPYRELAYEGTVVPYVTKYFPNTIVAYSFSKTLSLPGERIGYLVVPNEMEEAQLVFDTASNANRILGFINAPSLIQKVIGECIDAKVDVEYYDRNRLALYTMITELGFECIKPMGAFYLFMKSPMEDDKAFVELAKKYRLLLVSGAAFGSPGYVRLAYCVSYETILNAKESFQKLAEETLTLKEENQ
jgi:aspartate aminotransferase